MMATAATWGGTHAEFLALGLAVRHNCGCARVMGVRQGQPCGACWLLVDQRALDGLVMTYRAHAAHTHPWAEEPEREVP